MGTLLAFAGPQDPYFLGLIGEEEQSGPILSLMQEREFDAVLLLSAPTTQTNAAETRDALKAACPGVKVRILNLPQCDLADHQSILKALFEDVIPVCERMYDEELSILAPSDQPQVYAAWIRLVERGGIWAEILDVQPPKYPAKGGVVVREVATVPVEDIGFERPSPLHSMRDVISAPVGPLDRLYSAAIEAPEVSPDLGQILDQVGLIGDHPEFRKAVDYTEALAPSDFPMLILGETGTGKELFARLAHRLSDRSARAFIPLNCANILQELAESRLFGHRKGAFTGATKDQAGVFDRADSGTLFLDELGELSPSAQAKLLRVLDDGLVEPLGAADAHEVDVRIIAATNRDLSQEVASGGFREDLYYRLQGGVLKLPALRERRSDIPRIALHVLEQVNARLRHPKRLSQDALSRLQTHTWPGNVRDLQNVIERSARLARGTVLEADDLLILEPEARTDPLSALPEPCEGFSLGAYVDSVRKQLMFRAMEKTNGNKSEAAKLLGVTPQAVSKFFKAIEGMS